MLTLTSWTDHYKALQADIRDCITTGGMAARVQLLSAQLPAIERELLLRGVTQAELYSLQEQFSA